MDEPITTEPITVAGVEWEVTLHGKRFEASAPGFPVIHGSSYEDLENTAKVLVSRSRVRVSVPYSYVAPYTSKVKSGIATGIHSSNGNLLATQDGGPMQISNPYNHFRPMTEEDEQRYTGLLKQVYDLQREADGLRCKYRFEQGSLRNQVEHEIELARKKQREGK